jgi:hypothetical protein
MMGGSLPRPATSRIAAMALVLLFSAPFTGKAVADDVDALPVCKKAPPAAISAGLQRTSVRDSFSVGLPECSEQTGPEVRYMHGGRRWRCGAATVEVVWGMWGAESFGEKGTRCKAMIDGWRAMVVADRRDEGPAVLVWYRTGEVHEPIVSVSSPLAEDAGLVDAIAFSGRVAPDR